MANAGVLHGLGLAPFVPEDIVNRAGGVGPSDGRVLQLDSTQPGGVSLGTQTYSFNNQALSNVGALGLFGATSITGLVGRSTLGLLDTGTYTDGLEYSGITLQSDPIFTTTNLSGLSAFIHIPGQFTINAVSGKSEILGIDCYPFFVGSALPGSISSMDINTTFGMTGTLGTAGGLHVFPILAGANTITTYRALQIDGMGNASGTITTQIGLDLFYTVGSTGTVGTNWAMQVGQFNSRFAGLTTFGGTGVPAYAVHIQGGNSPTASSLAMQAGTSASTVPATAVLSSGSVALNIYNGTGGTNTYLLYAYTDASGTHYKYLQLNTTTVTWVSSSTLPT